MTVSDTVTAAAQSPAVTVAPASAAPAENHTAKASAAAAPAPAAGARVRQQTPRRAEVHIPWRIGEAPERAAAPREAADSVRTDSVAADPMETAGRHTAVVIARPASPAPAPASPGYGFSWIYCALFIIFCTVCIRFRNNARYLTALLHDLTEVRERENLFDDTVRETSFLTLLNLLWAASAGVLLWAAVMATAPAGYIGAKAGVPSVQVALCMGVTAVYSLAMWASYLLIGTVFSDRRRAKMWARGFLSAQGLSALVFFPLALIILTAAGSATTVLTVAAAAFIIAKIIFIYKGFRIFFTKISSWVLFLYYLCSLEIVPLILTYLAALLLCAATGGSI